MDDKEREWRNFELFTHRRYLSRFLARYELYKKVLNIKGSIIECGVWNGGGLLAWAKLSSIFEPYAIHRKIIGFDTFEGFPSLSKNDDNDLSETLFSDTNYDHIIEWIKLQDKNRISKQNFTKILTEIQIIEATYELN